MKQFLIVGLGNKGEKYNHTRHNVGFMFIDFLLKKLTDTKSAESNKFLGSYWQVILHNCKVHLLCPHTMMNDSGKSVRQASDFFKIPANQIIIVYDDLDLEFGQYKLQFEKSPHGHNGVLSVIEHLGKSFWNLRIGVENRNEKTKISGSDFVLAQFDYEEKILMPNIFANLSELVIEKISS